MLFRSEMDDVLVIVGGNIPERDVAPLKELGVEGVFPTGSRFEAIAAFIRARLGAKETVG